MSAVPAKIGRAKWQLIGGIYFVYSFTACPLRARTAFRARSLRCSGVSFLAEALPPFLLSSVAEALRVALDIPRKLIERACHKLRVSRKGVRTSPLFRLNEPAGDRNRPTTVGSIRPHPRSGTRAAGARRSCRAAAVAWFFFFRPQCEDCSILVVRHVFRAPGFPRRSGPIAPATVAYRVLYGTVCGPRATGQRLPRPEGTTPVAAPAGSESSARTHASSIVPSTFTSRTAHHGRLGRHLAFANSHYHDYILVVVQLYVYSLK